MADRERVVTLTGGELAHLEARLVRRRDVWPERHGNGRILKPPIVCFLSDSYRILPDASWVRRRRWDARSPSERRGFITPYPDAVSGIRSATGPLAPLQRRLRARVASGATFGVLLDPHGKTVEVYGPGHEPETHRKLATAALDPALPAFVLGVGPHFEG